MSLRAKLWIALGVLALTCIAYPVGAEVFDRFARQKVVVETSPDGGPVGTVGNPVRNDPIGRVIQPGTEAPLCQRSQECLHVTTGLDAGMMLARPNTWYEMDVEDGTIVSGSGGAGCWGVGTPPSNCLTSPRLRAGDNKYRAFDPSTWYVDADAGVIRTSTDAGCVFTGNPDAGEITCEEADASCTWGEDLDAGSYACGADVGGVWHPNLDAGQYWSQVWVIGAQSTPTLDVTMCQARTCTPDGGW